MTLKHWVATYRTTGVRAKSKKVRLLKRKLVGVATNIYLRKMLQKPKRGLYFENKDSEVVYT